MSLRINDTVTILRDDRNRPVRARVRDVYTTTVSLFVWRGGARERTSVFLNDEGKTWMRGHGPDVSAALLLVRSARP